MSMSKIFLEPFAIKLLTIAPYQIGSNKYSKETVLDIEKYLLILLIYQLFRYLRLRQNPIQNYFL